MALSKAQIQDLITESRMKIDQAEVALAAIEEEVEDEEWEDSWDESWESSGC